ncbi:hypothetical protein MMC25_002637 [Agyrium rufum]|nr:hypothetical protein [Agyrium rufum]
MPVSDSRRPSAHSRSSYNEPDDFGNLNENVADPIDNPNELSVYRSHSLEDARGPRNEGHYHHHEDLESQHNGRYRLQRQSQEGENAELTELAASPPLDRATEETHSTSSSNGSQAEGNGEQVSRTATELYTISYLIFFAILGTLARLGLQAFTFYPGAPLVFGNLWANFAGSLVFGFLSEDRKLFRQEWGPSHPKNSDIQLSAPMRRKDSAVNGNGHAHSKQEELEKEPDVAELQARYKRHATVKKTIPLYIGLATGFCGSFTSFSSFMRDGFLALSNNLPGPISHPTAQLTTGTVSRSGGDSFMAIVAVILLNICMSVSALKIGAHVALGMERWTPIIPFRLFRRVVDPLIVFLAVGCWLGAVIMAIFPPQNAWRGEAIFALIFAPLGCLLRFYASLKLNGKIASFPLGTFSVNMFGTIILAMLWDLQHAGLGAGMIGGGRVGCQVLQGMMDGFCGCLTTVSTWVGELNGLRRRHSYIYGLASVIGGLSLMIVITGSLRWSKGFSAPACAT